MTERRVHTDSRVSENFTEDGLTTLTGQSPRYWGRYVVKELVDNALEAVEDAATDTPSVTVALTLASAHRSYVRAVTVADNGPGIDRETLPKIADVDAFSGTKRHYARTTRGRQGNALMTLLGIQYLADGGPMTVRTRGHTYALPVNADTISGAPDIEVAAADTALSDGGVVDATSGTAVSVEFGSTGRKWARLSSIGGMLRALAALNPHVDFTVKYDHDGETAVETHSVGVESPTVERYTPAGAATTGRATWFGWDAFEARLKADIRAAPDLTVEEFVGEFDGLSSRKKRDEVLTPLAVARDAPIGDVYTQGDDLRTEPAMRLLGGMQAATRRRSPENLDSTLGSVGPSLTAGTRAYLDHHDTAAVAPLVDALADNGEDIDDWRDLTLYYAASDAVEQDDHRLPFVFELAALPLPPDSRPGTIHEFGINQSVAYSPPNATVDVDGTTSHSIQSAFDRLAHDFVVVTNITCPIISFEDKGKQSFDTGPFEDTISDVVGKAIRKYKRELRPMLNRLEKDDGTDEPELQGKAHHGFIKETVRELFEPVYAEATDNGEFTITMRQFFYKMRPRFQDWAEENGYKYTSEASRPDPDPLELNYETFTDYVDEYEREELGRRVVHRADRGFFVEPHTNREIELSTKKVDAYEPDLDQYGTLLFVEKTGFYELLHKDFELTKRYDIGLINAQGYSTTATRTLIGEIQAADPSVTLLTLTDLDINGLGIAEDAGEADALSAVEEFDAERIGLTLDDIDEYELHRRKESRDYNQSQLSELQNRYADGDVSADVYEFLTADGGQAVEINALGSVELKEYLEAKLEERGIEKVHPESRKDVDTPTVPDPEEVRDDAISQAIGDWVIDKARDELAGIVGNETVAPDTDAAEELDDLAGMDDGDEIYTKTIEGLDDNPPKNWVDINEELVAAVEDDVVVAEEAYAEAVREDTIDILDERVDIDITITGEGDGVGVDGGDGNR